MTAFRAQPRDGAVELTWEISADEPFDGFEVCRRTANGRDERIGPLLHPGVRAYRDAGVLPGTRYSYILSAVGGSETVVSPRVNVTTPSLSATLHQNVPNPFNLETTIRFTVPSEQHVTLSIYDAAGRRVRTLADATYSPGEWTVG